MALNVVKNIEKWLFLLKNEFDILVNTLIFNK